MTPRIEVDVPNKRPIIRARPYFPESDIAAALGMIEGCLRSGALSMGALTAEFERRFAAFCGTKHAVAVNTGTAALEIGLRCMDLRRREVIVPTETFVATANAVLLAGGRPIFAEVHPRTLCLDIEDVARRITPHTAGVLTVHMAGLIQPDIAALRDLCDSRGLFLAEDAAHAHGASFAGRRAGGLGRFGCFSFYPTKIMTTGEGGMLTTDDDGLADLSRSYRNHGASLTAHDYVRVSANWRLPEISAALGLVQLARVDEFIERRRRIAALYGEHLKGLRGVTPPATYPDVMHVYWNYIVMLDEGIDRGAVAGRLLHEYGVPTAWPYDPPCHLQPVFMRELGYAPGDLPQSENVLRRHLSLPMHVSLADDDIAHVADSLGACVAAAR